jgi:hypothetical protein
MRVTNNERSFHQGVAWKTLIFRPQPVLLVSLLESYAPSLRIKNDRDSQTVLPDVRVYVLFTNLDNIFTLHLLHCHQPRESVPAYLPEQRSEPS